MMTPAERWRMSDTAGELEQTAQDILIIDVSDAALEAAASNPLGAAISFPNAPTVSLLVVCCSNDDARGWA
jgi:hypothetical protein